MKRRGTYLQSPRTGDDADGSLDEHRLSGEERERERTLGMLNRLVRRVLLFGLTLSATLLVAGLVFWAVRGGTLPRAASLPDDSLPQLLAGRPEGLLSLGLFALVLTPFVLVAGSFVLFARERDTRYALMSATVLAIMIAGLLLGRA